MTTPVLDRHTYIASEPTRQAALRATSTSSSRSIHFLDKQTPRTNTASNGIGPSSIRPLLTQLAMSNPWPSQPTTPFVQVAASTHVSPIRTSGSSHPTIWSRR
ncbi:hypothetical protein G6O67_001493 [Ophiocordyceps sinensis]|uniref:Uncharacterized protein n=1 Tax=Ophiocordyceps sinensis TaxID=72228 RepID=A0A8H4PXR5_9HYPO|nr:hypothetical protein G6O67_001493 [Ophiocordyceps sinensis]